MRNAFLHELCELAERIDNIALVVGDLGFGVVEPFANRFPDRFFNAGVAEQNMTGLAAGLASEGFHVFTYSIANFPTFRCAEQIRNDVAYHNLPVTVVAVGGGLAYGNLGYSHHAVQDFSLIRAMPNMAIMAPGDPLETRACLRHLAENPGPSYLRIGKAGEPTFHSDVPNISPGKWVPVRLAPQSKKTLLTTGGSLKYAFDNLDNLTNHSSEWSVHSLPVWGMATKSQQVQQLRQWEKIVVLEEHLQDGGFGSWLLEASFGEPGLLDRLALHSLSSSVCGAVGSQAELVKFGSLGSNILQKYT